MQTKKITLQLYNDVRAALEDAYRYDRIERYALSQVLTATEKNQPIEDVFIKCAKTALARHRMNRSELAA
jgi:hypothetical protein